MTSHLELDNFARKIHKVTASQDDDSVGKLTEWRPLCGSRDALQIRRLPPDFLSDLVASVNFMRLSLKKAAYVAVYESSVVGTGVLSHGTPGQAG
jgi:hypothetical protein